MKCVHCEVRLYIFIIFLITWGFGVTQYIFIQSFERQRLWKPFRDETARHVSNNRMSNSTPKHRRFNETFLRGSAFSFIFIFSVFLSLTSSTYPLYWCTDHTQTHHTRWDSSGREIGASQRPLTDSTRHWRVGHRRPSNRRDMNPQSQQAATGIGALIVALT